MELFDINSHVVNLPILMNVSQKIKVFVVEDDLFFLNILKVHLKANDNLEVHAFTTGEDCLENMHLAPDIIFLDYLFDASSSNMNGRSVFEGIKQLCDKCRIVFLSGQSNSDILFDLIKLGVRDYITKEPDFIYELDAIIKEHSDKMLSKAS